VCSFFTSVNPGMCFHSDQVHLSCVPALFLHSPNQQSLCRPGVESPQLNFDLPTCPLFISPCLEMDVQSPNIEAVFGFQMLLNRHLKILCSESEHRKVYVRNSNIEAVFGFRMSLNRHLKILCSESEHRKASVRNSNIEAVFGFRMSLNRHLKILCSESEHRKFYVRNPNKDFVSNLNMQINVGSDHIHSTFTDHPRIDPLTRLQLLSK
jgi:hypothetical protein